VCYSVVKKVDKCTDVNGQHTEQLQLVSVLFCVYKCYVVHIYVLCYDNKICLLKCEIFTALLLLGHVSWRMTTCFRSTQLSSGNQLNSQIACW
jgi:hypothetical protein